MRSNSLSLKYEKLTLLGCKDIGIRKNEFVAKTQFSFYYFKLIFFSVEFTKTNKNYFELNIRNIQDSKGLATKEKPNLIVNCFQSFQFIAFRDLSLLN